MTTIAFDGTTLVADRLATDYYGMKHTTGKIIQGVDWAAGVSGETAQMIKLERATKGKHFTEVLTLGYPDYRKDDDDPTIILVSQAGEIWRHTGGVFIPMTRYPFYAIGSGRDYAMAAMYCGKSAQEAVLTAAYFDVHTSTELDSVTINAPRRAVPSESAVSGSLTEERREGAGIPQVER